MAAAKGNQNAKGNTGGKSLNDRKLAAEVRSLALSEMKAILEQDGLSLLKIQIILKLAPSLLPRLNEHTGNDGEDLFPVPILSNMNVPTHNSNQQNIKASETNPSGSRGNVSQ